MHPFPTLQTNRLGLREITQDDAQDIFEIYSCAEVVRYYDCDAYESIEQALSQIQSWAANYSKDVAIRWGGIRNRQSQNHRHLRFQFLEQTILVFATGI